MPKNSTDIADTAGPADVTELKVLVRELDSLETHCARTYSVAGFLLKGPSPEDVENAAAITTFAAAHKEFISSIKTCVLVKLGEAALRGEL